MATGYIYEAPNYMEVDVSHRDYGPFEEFRWQMVRSDGHENLKLTVTFHTIFQTENDYDFVTVSSDGHGTTIESKYYTLTVKL